MGGEQKNLQSEEASKGAHRPPLVKFNRAFKLAEEWVGKMSNMDEQDKSAKVKIESRLPRLGVGAIIPRETKVVRSNDPVERKLRAKLVANKTKVANGNEESADPGKGGSIKEDSDDDELESKTKLFEKKRPVDWSSNLQAKKKHR